MGEFFHAVRVFGEQLADVGWLALAIALAFHFLKILVRTFAWRNILQASYPDLSVPWRPESASTRSSPAAAATS